MQDKIFINVCAPENIFWIAVLNLVFKLFSVFACAFVKTSDDYFNNTSFFQILCFSVNDICKT